MNRALARDGSTSSGLNRVSSLNRVGAGAANKVQHHEPSGQWLYQWTDVDGKWNDVAGVGAERNDDVAWGLLDGRLVEHGACC